ncbi:MAG: cold shock CspA family protein [Salibacteraceae bacterium]|jgi:cold shock CspA family protein
MAKSQETFGKKEREKKRLKKRQEKTLLKEERKANKEKGLSFEDQIAYVDEFGQLTDTPPDPANKVKVDVDSIMLGAASREPEEEVDPVHKGRVEFFNDSKGYGFIKDMKDGEKYFVHMSGLIDTIVENNMVTFELERGMKGMNAVKVKLDK